MSATTPVPIASPAPTWPLKIFRTAVAVGIVLLVLCGRRSGSVTCWTRAVGVAALAAGLVGCWCLVVVQLLTRPRGPAVRELVLAGIGVAPPALFVGLLLVRATGHGAAFVPEVVLSPAVAIVLTPVLVGWLALLAWRLLWPPAR